MQKFRKRPLVIEAMQFRRDDTANAILAWANAGLGPQDAARVDYPDETGRTLRVFSLEGVMTASDGDWIIKGIKGEFYPCEDSIFRETYEPV